MVRFVNCQIQTAAKISTLGMPMAFDSNIIASEITAMESMQPGIRLELLIHQLWPSCCSLRRSGDAGTTCEYMSGALGHLKARCCSRRSATAPFLKWPCPHDYKSDSYVHAITGWPDIAVPDSRVTHLVTHHSTNNIRAPRTVLLTTICGICNTILPCTSAVSHRLIAHADRPNRVWHSMATNTMGSWEPLT